VGISPNQIKKKCKNKSKTKKSCSSLTFIEINLIESISLLILKSYKWKEIIREGDKIEYF